MIQGIFGTLLEIAAGFISALLLMRLQMRWMKLSFFNPFGQFIIAATNWAIIPVQRFIRNKGRFEWATLTVLLAAQLLLVLLGLFVQFGSVPLSPEAWPILLGLAVIKLLMSALYFLSMLLIFGAILSWVNPHAPIAPLIMSMSAPILRPVRRYLPPLGGVDLSPLVLIIVLQVVLLPMFGGLYAQLARQLFRPFA